MSSLVPVALSDGSWNLDPGSAPVAGTDFDTISVDYHYAWGGR